MRPPKGFKAEEYPLRHRLVHAFQLAIGSDNANTAFLPLVRSSKNAGGGVLNLPSTIQVNPHNSDYEEETGPLCQQMSIIDRLRISMKFTMLEQCDTLHETAAGTFLGDSIQAFSFLWRPIFNVYPEKMDAADDDTTNTVAAILGMTKDDTNEDVVPVTTNNLPVGGASDTDLPISTTNVDAEVFGDYNMSTDLIMEDHVFDEDLLQSGLRRFTNKGALRSCLGRTRHVTLSQNRRYHNVYLDKFVPRAIRRIQPFALFGIQVHIPIHTHVSQHFLGTAPSTSLGHLGVKIITNYHEWNSEFDNDRGTPT